MRSSSRPSRWSSQTRSTDGVMQAPLVLAIDIGTSSVRASVYDARLKALRASRVEYGWPVRADGRVEADAARLEAIVMRSIDEALAGYARPIDAVGVAAFWHSLVAIDAGGRALTPVLPWSDLRSDAEADRLRDNLQEHAVHRRTGCRIHPSYWPSRLLWFRRHEPRVFDRVRRWMSFPELLERRWLGRDGVSISQASGTGLFLQDDCAWDPAMLRACRISAGELSPIVDLDDGAELSPHLKRRWPSLARARWLPAAGDGALNNVGAGCTTRGRAAVMIGTSGAMRVLWKPRTGEQVRTRFGIWRYRLDATRVVAGGALSNGGNVREFILGLVGRGDAGIERRAAALAPDSHGLTLLPFFAGTRSPDYLVHATGTLAGLTLATRPEHILRAGMEAVGHRFAAVLDELEHTARVREFVAAGGALERSPAWTQIIADIIGRPIRLLSPAELTSRGAAALALEQLGVPTSDALEPDGGHVAQPDASRHRAYTAARNRQEALLRKLRTLKLGT